MMPLVLKNNCILMSLVKWYWNISVINLCLPLKVCLGFFNWIVEYRYVWDLCLQPTNETAADRELYHLMIFLALFACLTLLSNEPFLCQEFLVGLVVHVLWSLFLTDFVYRSLYIPSCCLWTGHLQIPISQDGKVYLHIFFFWSFESVSNEIIRHRTGVFLQA